MVEALVAERNSSMIAHRLNDVLYGGTYMLQGFRALILVNLLIDD